MIPKFRAWYKSGTLPMLTVNLISFDQKYVDAYIDEEAIGETEMMLGFDEVILMQSTGLFDKSGKEIFEGDIVGLKCTVYSDYITFKVTRFCNGEWRIQNSRIGTELWLSYEECEVIGNIYENKELVEVANDTEV